jgi:peptide/nickel transport system permease protein
MDPDALLLSPSLVHPFGTDHFGRDVLSMVMAGTRTSLGVASFAIVLGLGAGAPLGLVAASRRGIVDELIMRSSDVLFAFPSLLLAVMISAILGPGAVNAVIAIGIFNIPVFARVTRGAALPLLEREWVLAARIAGKGHAAIALEHVAPNLMSVLVVQGTIQFSLAILAEAALSYVGLGTQPPMPSWGRMLSEAQTLIGSAPWLAIFPGLAIATSVLGFSLLGDGMRDLLDPRLRRERAA